MLLSEIEKSFVSISEKTLSKEIAFGPFTDCPLYPLSIQFFILQNNDDSYSGTISVALEGTAESTTIEVKYPTVDKENWYYQVGFMPIIEDIQIISNSDNSQILSQTNILIQKVLDRFALSLIENP